MSTKTIGIAILSLIVVAALALPVSAAATDGNSQAGQINSGLKDSLWNTYAKYRIQIYTTRVAGANEIITDLGNYGCPVSDLQTTVTAIENEQTPLQDALNSHSWKALKPVNQDLAKLWKEFRQQARASVKACSVQPVTTSSAAT